MDLEQHQVPPEDIVTFFVGKSTISEVVNYDPWKIACRELLKLFASREKTDLLEDLELSRLSRQFVNYGLAIGRNRCSSKLNRI